MVTYPPLLRAVTSDAKTLPDRIVDYFVARIFTQDLPPGERLPADRELAPLLGVDRTSLRMAMQQLARMGLVRIVHGSGVRVLDFREHAGIDFLAAVFALPGVSVGGSYLLQVFDDWIAFMPVVVGRAFSDMPQEAERVLDAIMLQQLELLDTRRPGEPLERVVELEVELQDKLVRRAGNASMILLGNSSRPLRRHLVQLYFEETDVRQHVQAQRALFHHFSHDERGERGGRDADRIHASYRAYLSERAAPLRAHLSALPRKPALAPVVSQAQLTTNP